MSKIYFVLLLFSLFFTTFQLAAEEKREDSEKYKLLVANIKKTVEYDTVVEVLRKFNMDYMKEKRDGKLLGSQVFSDCSTRLQMWMKYNWFVADTGIDKEWLKSVKDLVDYMYRTREYLYTARRNRNTENAKYKQAVQYYNVAYKRFVAKISKPEKVSLKIQRQVKVAKVKWQKAMAKKYKIKENF